MGASSVSKKLAELHFVIITFNALRCEPSLLIPNVVSGLNQKIQNVRTMLTKKYQKLVRLLK